MTQLKNDPMFVLKRDVLLHLQTTLLVGFFDTLPQTSQSNNLSKFGFKMRQGVTLLGHFRK